MAGITLTVPGILPSEAVYAYVVTPLPILISVPGQHDKFSYLEFSAVSIFAPFRE